MKSNTPVFKEFVDRFAQYESEVAHPSLDGFVSWYTKSTHAPIQTHIQMGNQDEHANQKVNELDNSIGILLGMLNKYARQYSKVAMDDLPLNTLEEFGYLAQLSSHHELTKTRLIELGKEGKTTGMDIIRRLISHGLAKEVANPEDKRSKLVRITEKGRKVIGTSYMRMGMVSKIVSGNLTLTEKQSLRSLLGKLEHHHQQHEHKLMEQLKTWHQ